MEKILSKNGWKIKKRQKKTREPTRFQEEEKRRKKQKTRRKNEEETCTLTKLKIAESEKNETVISGETFSSQKACMIVQKCAKLCKIEQTCTKLSKV